VFVHIAIVIVASLRTDHELVLENTALRQQLAVYKARYPRPAVADADRLFWIALSQWWPRWRDALTIMSPETVLKWHRRGFRVFWRRKSKRGAPPSIPVQIRETIQGLHKENDTWGAPRIHGELRRLDFDVSEATVSRYLARLGPRRPKLHSNQSWATFLRNHVPEFSAMDFFTVYGIFFRRHYVFFVLDHECRKIRLFAVTTRPTGARVLQQLREVFLYDFG
jgi:putative transposase